MFDAAIARAMPDKWLPPFLPNPPKGRTIVVGAERRRRPWRGWWRNTGRGKLRTGGHALWAQCAHPNASRWSKPLTLCPTLPGCEAAARILEMAQGLTADDLVLCLISGGGSALLALPAPGLTLQDKQAINRALLKSGANIAEMNCVRKHLSAIKGGRLAAACHPARVVTLTISDVPGDDPAVIASGPTVPDRTTFTDALAILDKYRITEPVSVLAHLRAAKEETPKPDDPRLVGIQTHVVAAPQQSLEAAANVARQAGVTPVILGDSLEGEAREVAMVHAGIARQVMRHGQPAESPCVLLSGGETTVTVRGNGRGGRNVEFLLALAVALDGEPGIFALAGDTDGVDGTEDNAGAMVTPDTLARAAHACWTPNPTSPIMTATVSSPRWATWS